LPVMHKMEATRPNLIRQTSFGCNCSGGVLNPNGIPHHSPGLARQGLPWVHGRHVIQPQRGCVACLRSRGQSTVVAKADDRIIFRQNHFCIAPHYPG
jgi:hypothetical protein